MGWVEEGREWREEKTKVSDVVDEEEGALGTSRLALLEPTLDDEASRTVDRAVGAEDRAPFETRRWTRRRGRTKRRRPPAPASKVMANDEPERCREVSRCSMVSQEEKRTHSDLVLVAVHG